MKGTNDSFKMLIASVLISKNRIVIALKKATSSPELGVNSLLRSEMACLKWPAQKAFGAASMQFTVFKKSRQTALKMASVLERA